jgi:hypothetical protein
VLRARTSVFVVVLMVHVCINRIIGPIWQDY